MRGAPGNTVNHTTSYWIPNHTPRAFVPKGWMRSAANDGALLVRFDIGPPDNTGSARVKVTAFNHAKLPLNIR